MTYRLQTVWLFMIFSSVSLGNLLNAGTCGELPLDIVFVLDTSSSIWHPDFLRQLKFVKDVARQFDIGQGRTQTRIGVVTFADSYYPQFQLWENNRMSLLTRALSRVRHKAGKYTNTASVIKYVGKYMFLHRYGGRKHALHVAVVITDGKSQNRHATLKAAQDARTNRVNIFAIGVGDQTDERELRALASKPSSDFLYEVEDYRSLDGMKFVLAKKACSARGVAKPPVLTTPPSSPTTPSPRPRIPPTPATVNDRGANAVVPPAIQADIDPGLNVTNCGGKPAEVYFALDASNSIWPEDFKKQLAFVRDLISLFDIQEEKTRIGLVTFSDHVLPIITLDKIQDKQSLLNQLSNVTFMSGRTDTAKAIRFIREQGFSRDVARHGVAHIALVFTDGLSKRPRHTAREAELAKRDGIYMFSIGIGNSIEKTELQDIASDPDEDYFLHVRNFTVLNTIKDILAIKTCAVQPLYSDSRANFDCDINRRTDLMFVYDSAQIGMHKTRKITKFVYDVTSELSRLADSWKLKVGRLMENCLTGADTYLTQQKSSMDFDQIYFPDFRRMIRKLASVGFSPQYGATYRAKKVAVLFLDGDMENLKQASEEIRRLRETYTYVVTIGDVDDATAAAFSSKPSTDYLVHIPSYKYLSTAKSSLLQKLCSVLAI